MKIIIQILLMTLTCFSGTSPFVQPETQFVPSSKVRVVVIGINDYAWLSRLTASEKDGLRTKRAFEENLGVPRISLMLNSKTKATKKAIIRLVEEETAKTKEDEYLIICFAGHGFHWMGRDYIAPYDAVPSGGLAPATSIPVDFLQAIVSSKGRRVIFIIDACRTLLKDNLAPREGGAPDVILVQSASKGQAAQEVKNERGLLMGAFADALNGAASDELGRTSIKKAIFYATNSAREAALRSSLQQQPEVQFWGFWQNNDIVIYKQRDLETSGSESNGTISQASSPYRDSDSIIWLKIGPQKSEK